MDKVTQLIDALLLYLQSQSAEISGIEYFTLYAIPIIQLIIIICTAGAGIYKYFQVKNREINEKMLSEVYAPLYNYFIKQELYCSLQSFARDVKESPILEMKSKKQTSKFSFGESRTVEMVSEESTVLGLNRDCFISILNNINIGLAGKELYTLLSMYEVVCHIESGKSFSDGYLNATILKVQIENALRKEILEGYNYYHKKLGISRKEDLTFCKIDGEQIQFTYNIEATEKEKLKKDIEEHPELYS